MVLSHTIGLRALLSAQRSMDIIGQNVANAATEGYSRRVSVLSPTDPISLSSGSFGTGVTIGDVRRVHDGLLESRIRVQRQAVGQAATERELLTFLDGYFTDIDGSGVSGRLSDFFGAVSGATAGPGDSTLQGELIQAGVSLSLGFRQMSTQISSVAEDARSTLSSTVDQINAYAKEIASLNGKITASAASGAEPSGLFDTRERLVQELSELVDVQALERGQGTTDILVDGHLLVGGSRAGELSLKLLTDGSAELSSETGVPMEIRGGKLRGLLNVAQEVIPSHLQQLDEVARTMILEVNRIHSTGVPGNGPFETLTSNRRIDDPTDINRVLSDLPLDFAVQSGTLVVNVVDQTSGNLVQHQVAIDPAAMRLSDVAAALNDLENLSASLDSTGRLRILADSGYGFDFSSRLDTNPDDDGTLGSASGTLSSSLTTFALSDGNQLSIEVDGQPAQTVTFQAADFADISEATAAEVAAAINASVTGATALVSKGRLVIQSDSTGSSSSLQLSDVSGTPSSALGLSTSPVTGNDQPVTVELKGEPADPMTGRLFIQASGDGTIGVTPGLTMEVRDEGGSLLGVLEVGDGYTPGEDLEVIPGVTVSFSAGNVSASGGDFIGVDLFEDSDTSDILVALEIATFFHGSDASTIEVADRIVQDPGALAGSRTGTVGDGSNLFALLDLQESGLTELGDRTILEAYADIVSGVGLEAQGAESREEVENLLLESLDARRAEISGVNLDEEMLKLLEMEQLHSAVTRYLQVVTENTDQLLSIV